MKSSLILMSAGALLATASPVRRDIVTDVVVDVVTVTVTVDPTTTVTPVVKAVETKPPPPSTTSATSTLSTSSSPPPPPPPPPKTTPTAAKPATTPTKVVESEKPTNTAASPPPSSGSGGGGSYGQAVVDQHNKLRVENGALKIGWDDDIASAARAVAEGCVYGHDKKGLPVGQNIAMVTGSDDTLSAAMNGINSWYAEKSKYNPSDPSAFAALHFTQMMWKGTTHCGCHTAWCPTLTNDPTGTGHGYYTVCNYSPAGNMIGKFALEVAIA